MALGVRSSKIILLVFLSFLIVISSSLNASAGIGEFKQTIRIEVNCDNCVNNPTRELKVQLYADGEVVPDTEVVLNAQTGFATSYEDLPVFRTENGPEEIEYQTGVSEDGGAYRILQPKSISYEKAAIDEWASVTPENLEDNHEYVFLTENWNYESNGQGKYILIRGDLELEQTTPEPDYKLIDGKKSYYSLTQEPSADAIWTLTKVSSDDPDYAKNPDAWLLTNAGGKRLVLSDFNNGSPNQIIWRYSGKNGYNQSENSYNTNKLSFVPINDNRSRFRLAGTLFYDDDPLEATYYFGINHFYQVQVQSEADYAAQFIAFEHTTRTVDAVKIITIEAELCASSNPSTGDLSPYVIIFLGVCLCISALYIPKRR